MHRLHSGAVCSPFERNDKNHDPVVSQFWVPCGQCGECRLARARSWATRCVHEASQWKFSCFITLTYKTPPEGNSLCPSDTRNFIRKFRYSFKKPFKYFLVGEYGENFDRPHYHALIFGHDFGFSDFKTGRNRSLSQLHDTDAVECSELNNLWGLGFTSVGELTFDSAAYCAQYAMKKVNGPMARDHYKNRHPEFMRTSQNAIGKQYANLYADEIITRNSVISNGAKQPIPAYYLKQYEKNGHDLSELRTLREEFSSDHSLKKSYTRAALLDAKFNRKVSALDRLRIRYAKDLYYALET